MDNREPIFAARGVRLMAPPQTVKDKHVRLRVAGAVRKRESTVMELHPVLTGPSPATTRPSSSASFLAVDSESPASWRDNISFKAMGWGMKECCDRLQLLAGDRLDIAYSLGMNDHPEFGGLELTLKDIVRTP